MSTKVVELPNTRIFEVLPEGPVLPERDIVALIGDALGHQADAVLLPASRLGEPFFDLSSRVAGEVAQKFVNYKLRLVIVGDIPSLDKSQPLRDFVRECNRGQHVWFAPTRDEAIKRFEAEPVN